MAWQSNPINWQYFIFDNERFNSEYRSVGSNTYKHVIIRSDGSLRQQGAFHSMPHLREFSTKDLYQPHPTLRNHWLYCGRLDDVIVFSNGEKHNPVTVESLIGQYLEIRTALVVGASRFQAGLIVEPYHHPGDDDAESSLLDRIQPHVQRINQTIVKYGRIVKHLIMLLDPARPFLYSGKVP